MSILKSCSYAKSCSQCSANRLAGRHIPYAYSYDVLHCLIYSFDAILCEIALIQNSYSDGKVIATIHLDDSFLHCTANARRL